MSRNIVVSGAFDDLRSLHFRFLEEAAKLGELTVLLWPDDAIRRLTGQAPKLPQPAVYAVNEDGDKGGKRGYCAKLGIEYLVLQRTPAPGLPKRSSTDLRGF